MKIKNKSNYLNAVHDIWNLPMEMIYSPLFNSTIQGWLWSMHPLLTVPWHTHLLKSLESKKTFLFSESHILKIFKISLIFWVSWKISRKGLESNFRFTMAQWYRYTTEHNIFKIPVFNGRFNYKKKQKLKISLLKKIMWQNSTGTVQECCEPCKTVPRGHHLELKR